MTEPVDVLNEILIPYSGWLVKKIGEAAEATRNVRAEISVFDCPDEPNTQEGVVQALTEAHTELQMWIYKSGLDVVAEYKAKRIRDLENELSRLKGNQV